MQVAIGYTFHSSSAVHRFQRLLQQKNSNEWQLTAYKLSVILSSVCAVFCSLDVDENDETLPHKPAKNAAIHSGPMGDGHGTSSEEEEPELDDENTDPVDRYNLDTYDDEEDTDGMCYSQ